MNSNLKAFRTIICLLMLCLIHHIAYAQQPISQQAFAIFEQHCLDCHGEFGSYTDALLIKHANLIEDRAVIPGQPNASELYFRLLGDTDTGSQMPLGQEPLDPEAIATIRRWIESGAPDWEAIPKPERSFITTEAMLQSIHTHVTSLTAFDRSFARYFTLTHLYNAGASDDNLRAYRNALSKLVNSLSWGSEVIKPTPIDREETIFYIDLRHYEWDIKSDKWYKIEQAYPYGVQLKSSTYTTLCQETNCELPFVRADWFIATASLPPLYHEILDLPKTDRELETRLEVDVAENIKNAPGVRVWRAGFNESGVSVNNRIVERHKSRYGAYWKSYDFAGNVGTQNIFTHPLNFTHDGGEIIFNLPNGLQAYYLSTAIGERLDEAPINIVSNAGARDPVVRNGLSCMGCHTEGMKTFNDQVRSVIVQSQNPSYDKAQALRLYAEKSEMNALIREDTERYKRAIEAAGGVFGGSEPIQQLVKQFEGPIDATHAAAEVGLETADFLQKIRENSTLQNAGLLVLGVENGTIKRDAWESQFGTMISLLNLGEPSGPYANMVLIPAGEFQMRSNEDFDGDKPLHTVYVDAFYMDKYKVTNSEYKAFLDANPEWGKEEHGDDHGHASGCYLINWGNNTYPSGKDSYPVAYVSYEAAVAYARWVGKRLPTEAEWEKAASTGLVEHSIKRKKINTQSFPVGAYPANRYGLYDMYDNVHEWCPAEDGEWRLRIGYFYDGSVRTEFPSGGDIDYFHGFRCVKDSTLNLGKHNNELLPSPTPIIVKKTVSAPKEPSISSGSFTSENMVMIPAGEFQMGSDDSDAFDDEKPVHTVYTDAFYMDKYEVTNAQYKKFLDANPEWRKHRLSDKYHDGDYLKNWNGNNYPHDKGHHPVAYVSWYAAMAYAKWAGKRLPTEAEWEKAARGKLTGQKYPWGNSIDSSKANYASGATTPVGNYASNGYGLHDMAGNVWEWCLDEYDEDFYYISQRQNPLSGAVSVEWILNNFLDVESRRILRGSPGHTEYVRAAYRGKYNPTDTYLLIGFRCVKSVTP